MKTVLDPCCGSRMFYFDKQSPHVIFGDIRDESHILCDGRKLEIKPDQKLDFRNLPFEDNEIDLIVFDPPHLKTAGPQSWQAMKYGKLDQSWKEDLKLGFGECWRVLRDGGTIVFKWNETQIKLKEVLSCFDKQPLFGHTTTHNLKTHWVVFYKERHSTPE